jgi:hypothetical protein
VTHLPIHIKLLMSLLLSAIIGALLAIVEYYKLIIIENKTFLILIFSAFICDVILGMWKHLKAKDFSFHELFTKALTKIAISFLAMVLFNAMAGVEGIGETPIKIWLLMVGKLLNIIYISGSAFNNMYYITDKKFPPYAWISRMKEFNKTLDTSKLTNQTTPTQDAK